MPTRSPDFLSVTQAAQELNITDRAVRHRIKAGTLQATKLGPGDLMQILMDTIQQRMMVAQGQPPTATQPGPGPAPGAAPQPATAGPGGGPAVAGGLGRPASPVNGIIPGQGGQGVGVGLT